MRSSVNVAGEVLSRPADLEQQLLQLAPLGGMHHDGLGINAWAQQGLNFLRAADFLKHGVVIGAHHQSVLWILLQPQPAVPGHRFLDVDQQRVGHREPGILQQCVQDALSIQACRAGIPEPQRGETVTVHVFGCAFELGECGDGVPCVGGLLMVYLKQDGFVALDNQGAIGHGVRAFRGRSRVMLITDVIPLPPQCR
ncbi:hypothetical protein AHiyo6_14410 [Arthrobacter sp. Hiyo6]|nr:hypothetical protein AHiyo6_14410 [Arthrobacter sp. Hiyo6]